MTERRKILMVLTSSRLDCFQLCMDMLLKGGSAQRFDQVALLLNGVVGAHRRYVDRMLSEHPEVAWELIEGPRGRGWFISNLQNECVKRHPGALYFKIDEDVFVSRDWDLRLEETYRAHKAEGNLSLVSATVPNNGLGAWSLLKRFEADREAFLRQEKAVFEAIASGCVWFYPHLGEWMTRRYLDLDAAERRARESGTERWERWGDRFSINCICYDWEHWQELGGVREHDEVDWGAWIRENRKLVVFDTHAICHHYCFFNQQDWLDRTSLLEDVRESNLGERVGRLTRGWRRMCRMGRQIPSVLRRRLERTGGAK